jgi:AcrR family transcriptional regulator
MDLRVQKTKNSILDAFIELRSEKPLEKITVKELADRARISKQTFYLHYKDIYDLSEQLEQELVKGLVDGLTHHEHLLEHSKEATLELFHAAATQSTLFRTVFSGSRASALTEGLEREIKKIIIANNPEVEHDLKANICLTILIHGCYLAYQKYSAGAPEEVAQILSEISGEITARCQSEM